MYVAMVLEVKWEVRQEEEKNDVILSKMQERRTGASVKCPARRSIPREQELRVNLPSLLGEGKTHHYLREPEMFLKALPKVRPRLALQSVLLRVQTELLMTHEEARNIFP